MKFVLDGQAVAAECSLSVATGDPLMRDFTAGHFFEASNFEMGMSLKGDDESNRRPGAQQTPSVGQFARWRSATQDEYKNVPFRLEFDRFCFRRLIDSASPIFFEACGKSRTFDSAVLVKRIASGDMAVGYLRLDFTQVLIIGVAWDDGDVVAEQCDFICQGLTVAYRQQQADGGFGATMSARWAKELARGSRGR
jgi:type VI protein secretion system component Hcp